MSIGSRNSQHSFATIPAVNMARSSFDRSFQMKDTYQFDVLVPIYVDEIIPGDTHNVQVNTMQRLATQLVPIMDNMYVDFFFFFVPNRLVFDNWEKMCGAQDNPGDSTDYLFPILTPGSAFTVGSIFDKMGLPTDVANIAIQNTLPLRCYLQIWNDWFRDQNMQDSLVVPTDNGPDVQSDFVLHNRGKRHDYFTSSQPWPQKGVAVDIPIGTQAPVIGIGKQNTNFDTTGQAVYETGNTTTTTYPFSANINPANADDGFYVKGTAGGGYPEIYADLSAATAATINQLRLAFMTQSLLELDARGGTRYVEILRAHYKVVSPDFRLQRAEFLGGGKISINAHPVAQTTPTTTSAQGNLAAFATGQSAGTQIGFTKSFVEHGYVIGLACARADLTYQQGINKMWMKSTRFDLFWPKLQELGEQAVLQGEIYAQGTSDDYDIVFGYQERYAEYRYKPSEIHGEFRSSFATPIDFWHLAQDFGSPPTLNSNFIAQSTPIARAIAVEVDQYGSNVILADYFFKVTSARPMATYSVPATLGRF